MNYKHEIICDGITPATMPQPQWLQHYHPNEILLQITIYTMVC